jgi:spermidine/putrescine transport system substrate-binding protein
MNKTHLIRALRNGTLSRRRFLEIMAAAGVTLGTLPMGMRSAQAGSAATYFTWGGYDDPELFTPYTAAHGAHPSFSTFGDSEEGLQRTRAGFVWDVAHPCNQAVPRWVASGYVQPIETARLSHFENVFPSLAGLEGAQADDGNQWFVPVEWGNTSITYRSDLVEIEGEESWGILWDERYAGRIAMIASAGDAWWCAAIYAGVDFANVTDDDVERVNELLRQQRPLVRLYTSDMTSVEQALASGEVVAAMTWNETPVKLQGEGIPVRFAQPKEGTLTWCCGAMMHKDAPNPDLAHDIIDSLISPEVGQYFIEAFGYGHSNRQSFELVGEEGLAAVGLPSNPSELLDDGVFQLPQSQDLETRINNDFEEIMAGF